MGPKSAGKGDLEDKQESVASDDNVPWTEDEILRKYPMDPSARDKHLPGLLALWESNPALGTPAWVAAHCQSSGLKYLFSSPGLSGKATKTAATPLLDSVKKEYEERKTKYGAQGMSEDMIAEKFANVRLAAAKGVPYCMYADGMNTTGNAQVQPVIVP